MPIPYDSTVPRLISSISVFKKYVAEKEGQGILWPWYNPLDLYVFSIYPNLEEYIHPAIERNTQSSTHLCISSHARTWVEIIIPELDRIGRQFGCYCTGLLLALLPLKHAPLFSAGVDLPPVGYLQLKVKHYPRWSLATTSVQGNFNSEWGFVALCPTADTVLRGYLSWNPQEGTQVKKGLFRSIGAVFD